MVFGRRHVVAILLQTLIDLIHDFFAFHEKADMEAARVSDSTGPSSLHQRQHKVMLVHQKGHSGIAAYLPHSEVSFQEFRCRSNVRNSKVDMVQSHGETSLLLRPGHRPVTRLKPT